MEMIILATNRSLRHV